MYIRVLDLRLERCESAFLWGPRQTGKSTLLRERFADARRYDLLLSDEFRRLTDRPALLREECLVLAESGRPDATVLVDEIHWLVENTRLRFLLCGSSARRLKRGRGNLLGGRAVRFDLHPLVSAEIPNLDLETALSDGLLPPHSRMARSCNTPMWPANAASAHRRCVRTTRSSRTRFWGGSFPLSRSGPSAGSLPRVASISSTSAQLEVDFVLGDHQVAVEVKGTPRAETHHLRGLRAIGEEYDFRRRILISCDPRRRIAEGGIEIVPWRDFLAELWSGDLVR